MSSEVATRTSGPSAPWRNAANFLSRVPRVVLLSIAAVVFIFPFIWLVITSLKGAHQMYEFPPSLIPKPLTWSNYVTAWNAAPFARYLLNSIIVTALILVTQLVTCSLAAYAFAFIAFRGRDIIFAVLLAAMMVPAQVTMLPNFLLLSELKLLNTYAAMVLPFIGSAFGTFLLRQRFLQVPQEFREAARLEGAGELRILRDIMVPLALPTIATFGLLSFVGHWNDYFWPLIVTSDDSVRTLPIGLARMSDAEGGSNWNVVMAANVFLVAPVVVVFLLVRRQLVKAFVAGGLK